MHQTLLPNTFRHRAFSALSLALLALSAVAQSPGTWSGVQVLEPSMVSSSPPEEPVVASNAVGYTVAAWTSPSMGAAFSERAPGGAWTAVSSIHPSSVNGFSPQIAIGSNGVVGATWIVPGQELIQPKLMASVRVPGGVFSPPVAVVTGAYVFDSKIGVTDNGSATIVWAQGGQVKTTTRNPFGAWQPVVVLSASGMSAGLVDLTVNGFGGAIAAWQQAPVGSMGPASIAASVRRGPARSRWGLVQTVSSGTGLATWNAKTGIDDQGNAAVGYLDGNSMVVARKPLSGAWTPPQQVSLGAEPVYYPGLAMDGMGNVLVAWQSLDAGNKGQIWKRSLPAVGAWGPVIPLSTNDQDASWPKVALSRDGSVGIVTWGDNNTSAAHAAVGTLMGSTSQFTIGSVWWNTSVPVTAGSAAVSAVWPAPTTNPNVTKMVANVYVP